MVMTLKFKKLKLCKEGLNDLLFLNTYGFLYNCRKYYWVYSLQEKEKSIFCSFYNTIISDFIWGSRRCTGTISYSGCFCNNLWHASRLLSLNKQFHRFFNCDCSNFNKKNITVEKYNLREHRTKPSLSGRGK